METGWEEVMGEEIQDGCSALYGVTVGLCK